jgi:hypothetical protein
MPPSLLEVTGLGPRPGPMSIEDIVAEAEKMLSAIKPNIPLRFYLRSADAINKQVCFLPIKLARVILMPELGTFI